MPTPALRWSNSGCLSSSASGSKGLLKMQSRSMDPKGGNSLPFGIDRSDLVVSAIILLICGILYLDTTRWSAVPTSLSQEAPPTLFPRLLIGLIAILAIALPLERVWKRRAGVDLPIGAHGWPKPVMFLTAAWTVLAVYMMPILGVLPVMFGSALVLPLLWGERRYAAVVLFAILMPVAVAALFGVGLRVNLAFGLTGDLFRLLR